MAKLDDDSWDITEGVGATALAVAAARAAETESEQPLFRDRFARLFTDAAGPGVWSIWSGTALPDGVLETDPTLAARSQAVMAYAASRTVYFDDYFNAACAAGVRQAVILGAGLDARAWRLPWPDATTVYELDQPKVLEFKASTLREHGAQPTSTQIDVPIDLRHDWPTALRKAGFDASAPTAWAAEGLLAFLPAAAQDLLFNRLQSLSAEGSWVAVEAFASDQVTSDFLARQHAQMQLYRAATAHQDTTAIPDLQDLWSCEERADAADWLDGHGWTVAVVTANELMARHDRRVPEGGEDAVAPTVFVSGHLPRR